MEESLEESRAELLALRTNHADTVGSLEAQVNHSFLCSLCASCRWLTPVPSPPQVSRLNCTITELQTLLRHKDESSRAYKSRTDAQVSAQLLSAGMQL